MFNVRRRWLIAVVAAMVASTFSGALIAKATNPSQFVESIGSCSWNRISTAYQVSPPLNAMGGTNTIGCSGTTYAWLYVCFKDLTDLNWYCYDRGSKMQASGDAYNFYTYPWGASPVSGDHQVNVGGVNSPVKSTYAP